MAGPMFETKDIKLSHMIPLFCPKYRVCFLIPFLLFHKVGITRELHCFILSHANAGLTISEIQTLWLQTMYDAYGSRRAAHLSAITANSKLCTSYPGFEQNFQNPGEKVIASCIAGNYLKKEHLLLRSERSERAAT